LIKTILGPPGCGKTQTNSNLIQGYIKEGIAPEQIACVSFTRKAAQESRERVSNDWNVPTDSLPYFQTLHSMAFRAGGYKTSDVIRGSDLKAIGDAVSVPFAFKKENEVESDFDKLGTSVGDTYLGLHHLSRSKCQSLEQTFREANNYNLHWPELKRLVDTYESYKKVHGKLDFTDMIDNFVKEDQCPDIEALFVDEAQDLSTLQWSMVDVLRKTKVQVFTGDDDQAIMGFQGADPNAFLEATEEKEVLQQSYRLPFEPWQEAQKIVSRIEGRQPKKWQPKEEEGIVRYHQDLYDVPIAEGEWCVMARTNRIASHYANALMDEGWVFSRNGHPSIQAKTYEAILDWEQWCKNGQIGGQQLRNIYTLMSVNVGFTRGYGPRSKALLGIDPETFITMSQAEQSYGLLAKRNMRWHQALDKIDPDTKNYILNALKRGDNIKNPRIKINTIHGMKGGECDNILVIPDLSHAAYKQYQRNPNMEHRVYYVAVTRTKNSLHIMEPVTDAYYSL